MRKTRRYISLIFIICLIFSFTGTAGAAVKDIQGHWAQPTIEKWINKGLIGGYSDSSFKPDNEITRAEFMVLVNRAMSKTYQNESCSYKDVHTNDWFYQDLAISQTSGHVSGYPDLTFKPNQYISRQEAAAIIAKILSAGFEGTDYIRSLSDAAKIPDWSRNSINNVLGKKIMNGYPDGSFKPENNISRAESIVTLENALGSDLKTAQNDNIQPVSTASNQGTNNIRHNQNDNDSASINDTDNDGLLDFSEKIRGTDPQNPDTDGDGLTDGYECNIVGSNPLKVDTDGDSIQDPQEDFDSDGLSNIEEFKLGTNPWSADSDLDNLTDYDEINLYSTNPINPDTDGDGLSDGNEILYSMDPLNPDTNNNGIKDGDESFETLAVVNEFDRDKAVEPSATIILEGKNINSVSISNVGTANPYLTPDLPGYIGAPFNFQTAAAFNMAIITFKYDAALSNSPDFEPAIYYFNEQTKMLELLPGQKVNIIDGEVSAEVSHFSTYILLNKKALDEVWQREMKPPLTGDLKNVELVIGFAIDSSGSMSWNDPTGIRLQTAKDFVDKLDDNDKAAVIDFDYYATVLSSLTNDKMAIKDAIGLIDSSGGTSLTAGMQASINEIKDDPSSVKYIILLTDGVGDYDSTLTQQAIDLGIVVYTIGLGYGIDETLLMKIAADTGGSYYHAESSGDLIEIFNQTSQETVDLATDTDKDGISDYHEKRGFRTSTGEWIKTAYDNPDSDGDTIPDGSELVYQNGYFIMKSNPTEADSDHDGILDNKDPEPMVYSITDRTLALAAQLSYTNLHSSLGELVGDDQVTELKDFKIVCANNSSLLALSDFFDCGLGCVAIKISRPGKKDAVIFAIRGTEYNDLGARDFFATDAMLALGFDSVQSITGATTYELLTNRYPDADFFITGHSLGGRVAQDVLFKIYDANDGVTFFGWWKANIPTPVHSATFNALGYNKAQYFTKGLFKNNIQQALKGKLNNYYIKNDLVGEGLGHSGCFARLGTDIGPWTATDKDGKPIVKDNAFGYALSKLHPLTHFLNLGSLKYPNLKIF